MIELTIVVAIIAILTSIALPAYQAYTTRARVSETLMQMNSAKIAVTETVTSRSGGLSSLLAAEVGFSFPAAGTTYVASVTVADGGIVLGTSRDTGATPAECQFALSPTQATLASPINWRCTVAICNIRFVPATCRP